ncbi:DUF2306 domain-containing protein [Paenibacillus humicola]|uniref:DUF2306 domain-containing protein n=1 Tax=Paenibacillus humicola TaxID=3110540 RepID=UPI00237BBF2F|nr:DUF2306 domain-containing protein [Paenibacillus humicola]
MKRTKAIKPGRSLTILAILSLGIMIPFSVPYLTLNPDASRLPIASQIQFLLLVAHIGTALLALAAGFPQFYAPVRTARPRLHRLIGYVYAGSVGISGFLAIALLAYEQQFVRACSFLTLDALWLFTTWKGCRAAAGRNFRAHRVWMIRSFGMTLVAVSARALVPLLILLYLALNRFTLPDGRAGMIDSVLTVNIWAGLAADFIIVEWVLFRKNGEKCG